MEHTLIRLDYQTLISALIVLKAITVNHGASLHQPACAELVSSSSQDPRAKVHPVSLVMVAKF